MDEREIFCYKTARKKPSHWRQYPLIRQHFKSCTRNTSDSSLTARHVSLETTSFGYYTMALCTMAGLAKLVSASNPKS